MEFLKAAILFAPLRALGPIVTCALAKGGIARNGRHRSCVLSLDCVSEIVSEGLLCMPYKELGRIIDHHDQDYLEKQDPSARKHSSKHNLILVPKRGFHRPQ